MRPFSVILATILSASSLAAEAAQNDERNVGTIATSPLRDVGIKKTKIPAVLLRIKENPYSSDGMTSCKAIAAEVRELDTALGRDVDAPQTDGKPDIRTELAMDAGQDTINSLIPGRFLIRRISGATAAQRRARSAVYAGSVRRGFLKGLGQAKKCAPPAAPR